MNCLFVDYQIEAGKWRKQWADLGVAGKIVGVADFAAAVKDPALAVTLVVMHAASEREWETIRDQAKLMHEQGGRFFLLRVAAGTLKFKVSENALRCISKIALISGGSLVELRTRFVGLVEALEDAQKRDDWGTDAWRKRVVAIWNEWETGQSAAQKVNEGVGDDWTVAATLRVLAEGFLVAVTSARVAPSAIHAKREQAVRSKQYWLMPFCVSSSALAVQSVDLNEKAITKVAGSFASNHTPTVEKMLAKITGEPIDKARQDDAVAELVSWLKANYQLR